MGRGFFRIAGLFFKTLDVLFVTSERVKRFFVFVLGLIAIVFLVSFCSGLRHVLDDDNEIKLSRANIGVIEIEGMIQGSMKFLDQMRELRKNKNIKALIVRIDSPGGAVGASQEIFQELKKQKEKMPVVISMGNLAASGGLYISLGGSHIFALPGTLTGSMGVLTTITNFSKLLDKAYIDPITLKSGELKDAGNPTEPVDPKQMKYLQEMINVTFAQFKKDVQTERSLKPEVIKLLEDGRVLTGNQSVELGLADEIGTFLDAVEYAKEQAKIEGDPKLVFLSRKADGFLERIIQEASVKFKGMLETKWDGLFYLFAPQL